MKKILCWVTFVLCVLFTEHAWAVGAHDGYCGEGCSYTLVNGVLTISGTGPNAKIDDGAFNLNNFYTSQIIQQVIIKDGIKSIGEWAFYRNNSLTKITLPSSLNEIGSRAFWNCTGLQNVKFAEGLSIIGTGAFQGTSLTSVTLPNSLTTIGANSFQNTNLTKIDIPQNVTDIGQWAFGGTNISTVDIPDSVTYIGTHAFDTNMMKIAYCSAQPIKRGICTSAAARFGNATIGSYQKGNDGSKAYFDENGKIIGYVGKRNYTPAEAAQVVGDTNTLVLHFQ